MSMKCIFIKAVDELLKRNMQCAHGLALEGMERAILEDIRARHLTLYEDYVKVVNNQREMTGPDQLEFGDFNQPSPEDF